MILVNGIEKKEVNIDDSFLFGQGIFETINVLEKPLFLKEHINRINKSAKSIGIKNEFTVLEVKSEIDNKNIRNKVLKLMLTEKNKIFITRENTYKYENYKNGFSLTLSKVKRNSTSHLTYIKSVNYIENILEKQKAQNIGFDEVFFLNENNKLTETSSSNIFFVKDKKIYTPKSQCGLLNGIIRGWVLENFNVVEGAFTLNELLKSDEVFLTNSVVGIIGVNKIGNKIFSIDKNNITFTVQELYRKWSDIYGK